MESAMERLSSGKRINSAGDDAAGLSISHSMNAQITSLNQATRNANDGVAMINLAEGALDQVTSMLTRMQELATQSANGIYNSTDRNNLNQEFTSLRDEISRIANKTTYNGNALLNGSVSSVAYQVGDSANDTITATFEDMRASAIGGGADTLNDNAAKALTTPAASGAAEKTTFTITAGGAGDVVAGESLRLEVGGTTYYQSFVDSGGDAAADTLATVQALANQLTARSDISTAAATATTLVITGATNGESLALGDLSSVTPGGNISGQAITTAALAGTAVTNVGEALKDVDAFRSKLGAVANTLEHTVGNLMTRAQHTSAAMSRIMDADYATESANLAKAQVLQQAGTAMLAQANASTQNVLSLLK
jgi:flagellin